MESRRFQQALSTPLWLRELFTASFTDRLTWVLVAVIAASYFYGLTPGHVFVQDDFAGYVMQAENLVEGHRYTDIRYVPNPLAPWVSSANGYPPVYPLLLAVVYRWRGLDFLAMKAITVATFVVFLVGFAAWVRPLVSARLRVLVVILVGLSPVFWNYRDLVSSEFPYMMMSFLALLAMQRTPAVGDDRKWHVGWALLMAALLYASYGTRTVGIALPMALVLSSLTAGKWRSRSLALVLGLLGSFMILQAMLLTSPRGYAGSVHISARSILASVWFYVKSLTYAWQNGVSKPAQVVLAFVLTVFAAIAFGRQARQKPSVHLWYLLVYLGILAAWGGPMGIRGLMPVLPIYLMYVVLGISDVVRRCKSRAAGYAVIAVLTIAVGFTYVGALRVPSWQTSLTNVRDESAQELFSFLHAQTKPSDLLVFSKPRTIALFTGRRTASLGAEEAPSDSAEFLRRSGARFLIHTTWNPTSYSQLLASHPELVTEVFRNRDFQVFRLQLGDRQQTATSDPCCR